MHFQETSPIETKQELIATPMRNHENDKKRKFKVSFITMKNIVCKISWNGVVCNGLNLFSGTPLPYYSFHPRWNRK